MTPYDRPGRVVPWEIAKSILGRERMPANPYFFGAGGRRILACDFNFTPLHLVAPNVWRPSATGAPDAIRPHTAGPDEVTAPPSLGGRHGPLTCVSVTAPENP